MSSKQKCHLCKSIPENMLVLVCSHAICIQCSVMIIRRQNDSQYHICCDICQEITMIDELMYVQMIRCNKQSYGHKIQSRKQANISKTRDNYIFRNKRQQSQKLCNSHQQNSLAYACKSCSNELICCECIINGVHKNHQYISIKQYGDQVKRLLEQDLFNINSMLQKLEEIQCVRVTSLKDGKRELMQIKNQAIRQYQKIRQSLINQEKLVIAKCQQLIMMHNQQERSFRFLINQEIKGYQSQKIMIIDLINPLIQQQVKNMSQALRKRLHIHLINNYKDYSNKYSHKYVIDSQKYDTLNIDSRQIEQLNRQIQNISSKNSIQNKQPNQDHLYAIQTKGYKKICQPPKNSKNSPILIQQIPSNRKLPIKRNDIFRLI